MKVLEKVKIFFSKKPKKGGSLSRGKIIGLILIAVGNVSTIFAGTIAWFTLKTSDSVIDMVTGDIGIEINTVTAYKYVYPYYTNSTEFIDYDSEGVVKKFILEDHTLSYGETDVDDIAITSDDATITLGTKIGDDTTFTTNIAEANYDNVCVPATVAPEIYEPEFRYYLVGNDVFCGVNKSWSLTDGFAFAYRGIVTEEKHAHLDNIVVSAGSTFRLMETLEAGSVYEYLYFPLNSIVESSSPFRIIDEDSNGTGDTLLCLRSGIYNFTYSPNQLKIELRTKNQGATKDISVISNNSLDPTKISIDYAGSVNKTDPSAPNYYQYIEDYLPVAIHNQNTTMVLDVELDFTNTNSIDVGLKIERKAADSTSIFNLANKYQDTTHNLVGYLDDAHSNPLRASDFFNYYTVFTKTPFANTAALWSAMHRVGDVNSQKFENDESYDLTIDCPLNLKENDDSTTIPTINLANGDENIYHCYISIEYDYEHSAYFLDKNRLGKTYLLDRDFGFHFFGEQHREEQN